MVSQQVNSERELRERVASVALSLLDVPYAHQHRGRFVDCIGYIIRVGKEAMAMEWDEDSPVWAKYKSYGQAPIPAVLLEGLMTFLYRRTPGDSADLGDVLLLRGSTPSGPTVGRHLGIMVCAQSYAHADNVAGKVMRYPLRGTPVGLIGAAFQYPKIYEATQTAGNTF